MLETSLPRIRGMSAEDVRSKLIADLKECERTIQQERKSKKKGLLGAKAVLAESPFAYPKGGEPRRGMIPRLAASNRWARLEQFNAGDREVVFPSGTYKMHVDFTACCEDPAPT